MKRPLVTATLAIAAAFVAALACNPFPPATKPDYNPRVSPAELTREYRDGKSRDGKRVVMTLAPKSYSISPAGLHWHVVLPANSLPPTIVFLCTPPPDNSRFIEITGTVRGATGDEIDRGSGVKFTISVDATGLVLR